MSVQYSNVMALIAPVLLFTALYKLNSEGNKRRNLMLPRNFPRRKQIRKANALIRQSYSASLDTISKYEELDRRLGENIGATKERTKLVAKIYNAE